jgi:hypothetical protein
MDKLKADYNKNLDKLNKGFAYCEARPDECEKYAETLYNITKILSNIINELIKYQILPNVHYNTMEGFK